VRYKHTLGLLLGLAAAPIACGGGAASFQPTDDNTAVPDDSDVPNDTSRPPRDGAPPREGGVIEEGNAPPSPGPTPGPGGLAASCATLCEHAIASTCGGASVSFEECEDSCIVESANLPCGAQLLAVASCTLDAGICFTEDRDLTENEALILLQLCSGALTSFFACQGEDFPTEPVIPPGF